MKNLACEELKEMQIERMEHILNQSVSSFEDVNGNRRKYNRIIDRLPIELELQKSHRMLKGEVIDVSEYGSRFRIKEPVISEPFRISIKRFNQNIQGTLEKIIWQKHETYGTVLSYADDSRASLQNIIQQRVQVTKLFRETIEEYIEYLSGLEGLSSNKNENIGLRLAKLTNRVLLAADILERLTYDKTHRNQLRGALRECLAPWVYQSIFAQRSLEKPRGYPGDYRIIEMFYNCKPASSSIIGDYFDRYFINNSLAVAVRNRKTMMTTLLKHFIENGFEQPCLNILNIACGSCREIKDLFSKSSSQKELHFVCIDQDEEAIEFSKDVLSMLPSNIKLSFLNENIFNIIRDKNYGEALERQHIVYSIGLIDYLPDSLLRRVIRFCWEVADINGKLIFAHKNRHKHDSFLQPGWFGDWNFYPRDVQELLSLIKQELAGYSVNVNWEETNHIFFVIITKLS